MASLFAIAESDPVVSGELVGEIQSDGSILDSWNLPHAGRALVQQLSKCCGVVVSNIVERGFRNHHAVGIASWWQRLQMDQGADEQAGTGQQHNRKGHFTGNERLAQAQAANPGYRTVRHR